MRKLLPLPLLFSLLCSQVHADQLAQLETETTTELLLYYDWDELLVEAPTRRPVRIKDVAENISIVTAEEIAEMNVHSVNEILRTVTGFDFFPFGGNFGSSGALAIHASSYEHVLLLLDGVRLNDVDAGWPETTGIPVQIIDRIEIVKGPASSVWGSALGGVISIVTKQVGNDRSPTGTVYGSNGEGPSQDFRAEAAGRLGNMGYYLHGGYMNSDGLVGDRYFKNKSFYGKFATEFNKAVSLTFTAGYWYPELNSFDLPEADWNYLNDVENYLVSGQVNADLSRGLRLNLDLYYRGQKYHNLFETLSAGAFINDETWDNALYGGSATLTREKDNHTMLFGAELNRGENDRTWRYVSAPTISWETETRKEWAFYLNDTIKGEKLTVTPGLRYDHLSIENARSDDLINPSLGMTYKIEEETLFRATAARGFIRPGIGLVVGSAGYAGYPDLKPEELWSLQAGIESSRITNTHLKADVFYHRQDNTTYWNDDVGLYINGGVSERTGVEFNVSMRLFEHFTAELGTTYVWVEQYNEGGDEAYGLNIKLNYRSGRTGSMTLLGRYNQWNEQAVNSSGSFDDMIWDFHYNKEILTSERTRTEFFFSARNLFSGEYYWDDSLKNPGRWVEAGLRFHF